MSLLIISYFVFRDLKSQNVFLTKKGVVKIGTVIVNLQGC